MINVSRAGRAAALAVAAALVVSAGGAAVAAAPSGDLAPQKASRGTMDWGVKESFRGYVEGPIADGGIEVIAPAKRKGDGTFRWAKGKGKIDTDADTARIKLKGGVYFYGHDDGTGPLLEVTVTDPRIVIDGADSVLIADVISRGFEGGEPTFYDNIDLVTIDATDLDLVAQRNVVRASDLPTELTEEGAEAFVGFYAAGTAFDDLSFAVRVKR